MRRNGPPVAAGAGHVSNELHVIAAAGLAVARNAGSGDWAVLHVLRPLDLAGEPGLLDDDEHSPKLRAMASAAGLAVVGQVSMLARPSRAGRLGQR